MSDTKHTPTEIWTVDDSQNEDLPKLGIEPSGWVEIRVGERCIGSTYSADHETNLRRAHQIVQAVNSHAALTEALEEVDDYLDNRADVDDGIPNTAMSLLTTVRAALALGKDHQ